jgi:flagellar biosynthesis GTPase FlhF
MNSKTVLNKILSLLSKDEVILTYAKLADGTIVESATFDVGEDLFVVSEDGTKTPAPDGMHELALKDESGDENLIKVRTEGGKIVERENVELAAADEEIVKVEDLPQSGEITKADEKADLKNQVKSGTLMAEQTEDVETIPQDDEAPMKEKETESEDDEEEPSIEIELKKMMEKMAYRIEEMEKKVMKMEEAMMPPVDETVVEEEEMEEEELPKLDGAPIEEGMKFSASAQKNNKNYGKKVANTQSSFLSKLYR